MAKKLKGKKISNVSTITTEVQKQFRERPRSDPGGQSKPLPSLAKMVTNFGKAVVKDVINGRKRVDVDLYMKRIEKCDNCDFREKDRCTHNDCGCYLSNKCWWASEKCPLKPPKWTASGV